MQLISFLPSFMEQSLSAIAGLLLVAASLAYIASIVNKNHEKRIKPRPLSWIGWALMMGISLTSQVIKNGFEWNQITILTSVIFCVIIAVTAFAVKSYSIKPMDWWCLILGMICVGIYLSTKNALVTTIFGIIADFIVAIPTIHNAYTKPESEKSSAWLYGVLSWAFTLIICIGYAWVYALFPLYLFVMNSLFMYLTKRKV